MRIHNREIQPGHRGHRRLPGGSYDWNEFLKEHKNKIGLPRWRESGNSVCRKSKCKGPVEGWVYSRFRDLKEGECSWSSQNVNCGCKAQRSQEEKTWKALWVRSRILTGLPCGSDSEASAYPAGDPSSVHLGLEDPLEMAMTTHSSILAWKIPWTEEPGRLQSMGSQRVRHDWVTSLHVTSGILSFSMGVREATKDFKLEEWCYQIQIHKDHSGCSGGEPEWFGRSA